MNGGGGARKAKAERGQHDTPVEAVREPADRNLEREPTEHRHQYGRCDRLARDAFVLHPGRNERVERTDQQLNAPTTTATGAARTSSP